MKKVAVIGTGSWGVALATHLAKLGNEVKMWSFSEEEKPEWINLKDIENYQVQMNEMLEKNSEEEI